MGNFEIASSKSQLRGPIPVELGNLANLQTLNLAYNDLTGLVPADLGSLAASFDFSYNALSGSIPSSFVGSSFRIDENAGLCVPGSSAFIQWRSRGWNPAPGTVFCNEADVSALNEIGKTTRLFGWTNSQGWSGLTETVERHGVATDSLGLVLGIDLSDTFRARPTRPNDQAEC